MPTYTASGSEVTQCSNAGEFGFCENSGVNTIDIGNSEINTVVVKNLDADIQQTGNQINKCTDTNDFIVCGNLNVNRIDLGRPSSSLTPTLTLSNVDFSADQSASQENNCSNGDSISCSNSARNDILIGFPLFALACVHSALT